MTSYQTLTNKLIELAKEYKRLTEIWRHADPLDEKIEGWDDEKKGGGES